MRKEKVPARWHRRLSRRRFLELLGTGLTGAALSACAKTGPTPARVTLNTESQIFPQPGEWICFRANSSLSGYVYGEGRISRPKVAWKQLVSRMETLLTVQPGTGSDAVAAPAQESAEGLAEALHPRWGFLPPTAQVGDQEVTLVNTGTTTYAKVLPGEPELQKLEFGDSFGGGDPVGRCFAWRAGKWEEVWETEPITLAFSPRPIAGDFDGDGKMEVAVLPWDLLWVFDAQTGQLKDKCALSGGRNYGFYGAFDLNGNGKSEFVVQADFAKHVDVIGYRGDTLERFWNLDIELGIQDPQKVFRVNPNPVGDVDGDGKLEVLVNAWDVLDDGRWHVSVHDGITGELKADLVDECLQGVVDVTGDGTSELLTVRTAGRNAPRMGTVMIRSCADGVVSTLWEHSPAAWQTWDRPLPMHINSGATLGQRDVLWRVVGDRARVAFKEPAPNPTDVALSIAAWGEDGLQTTMKVTGPALEALGMNEQGAVLLACDTIPGTSADLTAESGQIRLLTARPRRTMPSPVVVGRVASGGRPVIVAEASGEEIVAFQAPEDGQTGDELWRLAGWGQGTNWYWGTWHRLAGAWENALSSAVKNQPLGPVIADLSGDGDRQCVFATAAPSGCARLVSVQLATGQIVWHHDFSELPGTVPVWNTGGILVWRAGRFTVPQTQDIAVTVRRGIMHSEEIRMLSGKDGSPLWRRHRQSTFEDGIGGFLTVADYNGDGMDEVISFYSSSKEVYNVLQGSTGEDLRCWAQGTAPCMNYEGAIGIAGNMEGSDRTGLFLANSVTGLATQSQLIAWAAGSSDSPKCLPAFGDVDGDGRLEAVVVENPEGLAVVCYDAASGEVEWQMPALSDGTPVGSASADVNGDGRDEVLFTEDKTVYCLGAKKRKAQGSLLWKVDLPAMVGPPTIADVDGNGTLSILVAGNDGYVYCVR